MNLKEAEKVLGEKAPDHPDCAHLTRVTEQIDKAILSPKTKEEKQAAFDQLVESLIDRDSAGHVASVRALRMVQAHPAVLAMMALMGGPAVLAILGAAYLSGLTHGIAFERDRSNQDKQPGGDNA